MVKKTDNEKIRELAELLDETNLSEIEIESNGTRIRVARQIGGGAGASIGAGVSPESSGLPASAPIAQQQATEQKAAQAEAQESKENIDLADHPGALVSPMVGTIYVAAEPGAAPFCKIGDQVSEGQTLFIIEAMKTMNPIAAPRGGVVKKILISNAEPVEFGEVLAIIE
ncbi:MAG: acetyl-CoA carboxylase biotin carboxyl carrier protein [Alphaproteobacteria bacterium]|nr:acetyl-CoA carboxylase biotin carboxyl carrier protein [Alphaproteobacteria bacterium]